MKLLKLLLVLSIFLKFYENKQIHIIRKLEEGDSASITTEEIDTSEVSESYIVPSHNATSDTTSDSISSDTASASSSYVYPSHSPSSDTASASSSYVYPSHNPSSDTASASSSHTLPSQSGAPETTVPFVVPTHPPETTIPYQSSSGSSGQVGPNQPDIPGHSSQNPNGTLTTAPSPATKSYIILLGFDSFRQTETPRPPQPGNIITVTVVVFTFKVHFVKKNFPGYLPPYMHFHLDVGISRYLRLLEETQANCEKILETGERIEYNCSSSVEVGENDTIAGVASKNDYVFNNGTHDEVPDEDSSFEFYQSSYANSTSENLDEQKSTELSNTIIVNNANVNIPDPNKPYFEIVGNANRDINGNEVTFSFDEKGDGKLKNVTCTAIPLGANRRYRFECETEKSLKVHINNVMGKASNGDNVLLIFDKNAEGNFDDLLVVNNGNNFYGKRYGSNAGLSGGAIAGIVIACVCALIAIGLLDFCCRNKGNPAPMQETVMQIYSSNSNPDNL